ncbi:MAG: cupin domain-containing protein [Cyanobacteria bacterium]|nr:cupin domain-containing protein [Cyanobacteriota bacterium]
MYIRKLMDCEEFIAGDNTMLREILHPDKAPLDLRYSLAHAKVPIGKTTYLHSLKTSEIYYILEGKGKMFINDECATLEPGDTVYIPPNAKQCIENISDQELVFICIVDPAWKEEDEVVTKGSGPHNHTF